MTADRAASLPTAQQRRGDRKGGAYLGHMAKQPKALKKYKGGEEVSVGKVSEPQDTYARKATRNSTAKGGKPKGYDAKRYTGMIPGIAKRMKDYLKQVRDDR